MRTITVNNGGVALNVLVAGPDNSDELPILCVHGWPELAHSWRHQIAHFAGARRRIAAMDVRGYGGSSKPQPVADYTLAALASDVAAVIAALGGRAILFGHDWGAPIVWNTALRYPEHVAAVAGLSVPFSPWGELRFLDVMRQLHAGKFFYQFYFMAEGVAEAELAADPDALLKIYHALSGDTEYPGFGRKGPDATLLEGVALPDPHPAWLPPHDLAVYQAAFAAGGWRGPLNRYRAQDIDFAEAESLRGQRIAQPAAFIAGTRDPVRYFAPGMDLYATAGAGCADFRGTTLIEGAGHWVQQEAAAATNAALSAFVDGL
ncbi:alpha/beta hydrolase [Sandarakinorhabdus sp.]|uniref:alpha/beta hydrolase n=1 Tax=Sandarakinorhabdus sp. TaxID=1916663 RepID=UPI0033406FC5